MSDNKSRDIFYGVVAIATLIVALIGATLAYFSISANSEEGAVNAKAAVVKIEYNDGQQVTMAANNLIPSSWDVVKRAYDRAKDSFNDEGSMDSNLCIDDLNQEVCSIYRFTLKSDDPRSFTAKLNTEHNGFQYLDYAVRDVNSGTWIKVAGNDEIAGLNACDADASTDAGECFTTSGANKTYSTTTPKAVNSLFGYNNDNSLKTVEIGSTEQKYDIVLFILENNDDQNIDQGKQFQGTIYVETTGTNIITGTMN